MLDRWTAITCRQAHRLLSERMDHALSPGDQVRLWFHLHACDLCSRVEKHMELMRAAVRRIGHSDAR
jgi:hypothetical protein